MAPKTPKAFQTIDNHDFLFASKHSRAKLVKFCNLTKEILKNVNAEKKKLEANTKETQKNIQIA
jgi:hypothetical protein